MGYDSMFTSTRRTSEINWNDWPSTIDAFQQRYEEWYFNPLIEIQKTGHEAFPVYLTCGMLISNLATFIFGDEEKKSRNILYCLDTEFAEPVSYDSLAAHLGIPSRILGLGITAHLDVAEVVLDSFQSLLSSSSMGRICSLSGTGQIVMYSDESENRGPRVIIDPWVFRDRIREFFLSYCDHLRLNPHSAKSRMFRKMMKEHLGITITLTPTVSWPDNPKEEVKSSQDECSHEEGCGTQTQAREPDLESTWEGIGAVRRMINSLRQELKETMMTKDDFTAEITRVTDKLDGAVSLLHELRGLIGSGVQGEATPEDLQAWHDTLEQGLAKLQTEVDADTPPTPAEPVVPVEPAG